MASLKAFAHSDGPTLVYACIAINISMFPNSDCSFNFTL